MRLNILLLCVLGSFFSLSACDGDRKAAYSSLNIQVSAASWKLNPELCRSRGQNPSLSCLPDDEDNSSDDEDNAEEGDCGDCRAGILTYLRLRHGVSFHRSKKEAGGWLPADACGIIDGYDGEWGIMDEIEQPKLQFNMLAGTMTICPDGTLVQGCFSHCAHLRYLTLNKKYLSSVRRSGYDRIIDLYALSNGNILTLGTMPFEPVTHWNNLLMHTKMRNVPATDPHRTFNIIWRMEDDQFIPVDELDSSGLLADRNACQTVVAPLTDSRVALGYDNGEIIVLGIPNDHKPMELKHAGAITGIAAVSDKQFVASSDNGIVQLWDLARDDSLASGDVGQGSVLASADVKNRIWWLKRIADGRIFVSDGRIIYILNHQLQFIKSITSGNNISSERLRSGMIAACPVTNTLAIIDRANYSLDIINIDDPKNLWQNFDAFFNNVDADSVSFFPDGRLACASKGGLKIFALKHRCIAKMVQDKWEEDQSLADRCATWWHELTESKHA